MKFNADRALLQKIIAFHALNLTIGIANRLAEPKRSERGMKVAACGAISDSLCAKEVKSVSQKWAPHGMGFHFLILLPRVLTLLSS